MQKIYTLPTGKKIIIVSLFSGFDLLMRAFTRQMCTPGFAAERKFWACRVHEASFKHADGLPIIGYVAITKDEYKHLKGHKDTEETAGIIDGQHVRTISIEEITGQQIRAEVEARHGKDIHIILVGGPPCTRYTKLAASNHKHSKMAEGLTEVNRKSLVFDYLRILRQLCEEGTNVCAVMEEVEELGQKNYGDIYDKFIDGAKKLPFRIIEQNMCALHHGGHQQRWRKVILFVHNSYTKQPVFPTPDLINIKRVRDYLDIDYFQSGHFTDLKKTKHHFMCTVTSGSPRYFWKDGVRRSPTTEELMLCMDLRPGECNIPDYIPKTEILKGLGNGVSVNMFEAIALTIIRDILGLKHIGDGYFAPIDTPPQDEDNVTVSDTPVEPDGPQANDGPASVNNEHNGADMPETNETEIAVLSDIPVPPSATDSQLPPVTDQQQTLPDPDGEKPPIQEGSYKADSTAPEKKSPSNIRFDQHIPPPPQSTRPPRILNSIDICRLEFDVINFNDPWAEFFGFPSKVFHCIIHGQSGNGKSTFAIQLAKYLADNHGKVFYISGEEGFNKTFKDKLVNNDAFSPNLNVGDFRRFEDAADEIRRGGYKFVFIDSLDTMKIGPDMLRKIKQSLKGIALITISQATKGGDIRGSNELVHDSDIVVKVTDGIAVTTKNRFCAIGKHFNVFRRMVEKNSAPVQLTKEEIIKQLTKQMKEAVKNEDYELAAQLRDRLEEIKSNG